VADFDDLNATLGLIAEIAGDIMRVAETISDAIEEGMSTLEEMSESLAQGGGEGGGGGAASGGRKGGGGGAGRGRPGGKAKGGGAGGMGDLLGMARRHPGAAIAGAVGSALGAAVGGGAVSAARGGEFTAGFESSINRTIGKIPFVGEFTGVAGGNRIEEGTTKKLAQAVGAIEAIAGTGSITPDVEQFLIKEFAGQEERRETGQERIKRRTEEFFRDNPGARGNRTRITSGDLGAAALGPGGFLWRKMMEDNGLGSHK